MSPDYELGFAAGIRFVVSHLLIAAARVEDRNQIHYGRKLRQLATELDHIINTSEPVT